jgi:DNA-binding NarL/FixJ family response regulator
VRRRPPVPPAKQHDSGRDKEGADEEGVHQDAERQRGENVPGRGHRRRHRGSAAGQGSGETDVARLVAEGLTNKQIGARLFISERTVNSHVRSILNKLGVNSRAQIAAWMASAEHR